MEAQNIQEALFNSQQEFKAPEKDGYNPHFSHKYTTLGELISHTRPVLAKHKLMTYVTHAAGENTDSTILTLFHLPTKQSITSEMSLLLERKNNHAQGSACTYSIRYLLEGLLMLPGPDDDGNASCVTKPAVKTAPPPKVTNPLLDLKTPEKLMEKITNEFAKNDPTEKPQGWLERLALVEEAIQHHGWQDHEAVNKIYGPIKSQVNLAIQGAEVF